MNHLTAGAVMTMAVLTINLLLDGDTLIAGIASTVSSLIAMLLLEAKDKAYGSKFDWLDVAAGMLVPAVVCVCLMLIRLCM